MNKFKIRRNDAIDKLKALKAKQLQELQALREKQEKYLLKVANKLGINVNKSLRQEVARKLFHVSSLWIPIAIYFLPKDIALTLFATLIALDLIIEFGNYKKWHWARYSFGVIFYKILRSSERRKNKFQLSGSLYVLLASFLSTALFSKEIAIISMSVMIISDASAAIYGKFFGIRKIYKNKTTEGVLAFFVSSLFVMMMLNFLHPITYASIIACMLATITEIFGKIIKVDDNLSIPLVIGFILSIL